MPKQFRTFSCLWVLVTLGASLALSIRAAASTSVSYYGISWTFSADRPTGTFANGEPWVVGPVTITAINPNPSQSVQGVQNGSMVNPIPNTNFGFDSNPVVSSSIVYESAKNAALSLPLTLKGGDVIVSAKSQLGNWPTWLKTVCALTVLNAPPASGSFRPGIFGTDRTVKWNTSQINWNVLKNYAAVAATPSKASIAAKVPPLPWFEWATVWSGNSLQTTDNTADGDKQYGRETAAKFGEVGLWLNTNQPLDDKKDIAIRLIQNGIDIHNYVKNGGGYYHDGGHKLGRKLPLVIAAMMLNDAELKGMAGNPDIFQEDTTTWFVNQGDVGRVVNNSYPGYPTPETYRQEDVGMAEWGIRHRWEPFQDNRNWATGYRSVVGPGIMGAWITAYLMGAQSVWNHPAAFGYMQRFKSIGGTGGVTSAQLAFNQQMWTAYMGSGGTVNPPAATAANPVINPSAGYFETSQSVSITCSTASSTIYYTLNGSTPTNSSTTYTGPISVASTQTIKAIAYASGMDPSGVTTAQLTFSASPPTFSPLPGGFSAAQNVTLSTTTANAIIRYTTDGSDPTAASAVFSSPIPVSATTTIKAATFKAGLDTSPVSAGVYAIGQLVASADWISVGINPPRTEAFVYEYDATPSAANIDGVVGLGGIQPVVDYTNLACAVRFNTSGMIDVRSGSAYQALVAYPYTAGTSYRVRVFVYPKSKTYDVKVSANGGPFVELAKASVFRTEQASLASFNCMGIAAATGSHSVSNFGVVSDRPNQVQSTNANKN